MAKTKEPDKILFRRVKHATTLVRPVTLLVNDENNTLIGSLRYTNEGKLSFNPDGTNYLLSVEALRGILWAIETDGLTIAT